MFARYSRVKCYYPDRKYFSSGDLSRTKRSETWGLHHIYPRVISHIFRVCLSYPESTKKTPRSASNPVAMRFNVCRRTLRLPFRSSKKRWVIRCYFRNLRSSLYCLYCKRCATHIIVCIVFLVNTFMQRVEKNSQLNRNVWIYLAGLLENSAFLQKT